LLSRWTGAYVPLVATGLTLLSLALWLWLPAYLLLMQKRVYAQGWVPTVLRFIGVGPVYSVLVGLVVAVVFLLSLARICPGPGRAGAQRRAASSSHALRRSA